MSTLYNSFGRNVMALMAALLNGTTFVAAATGPSPTLAAVGASGRRGCRAAAATKAAGFLAPEPT